MHFDEDLKLSKDILAITALFNVGILITGGSSSNEARTTAEVYEVSTGRHCILPQLPDDRYGHTQVRHKSSFNSLHCIQFTMLQNDNIICGGVVEGSGTTCIQLIDGQWRTSNQLKSQREYHCSWKTLYGDVLIIGGGNLESRTTTELVKSDGSTSSGTLTLKHMT